ncbi:MAG: YicC/YloC family endoribonuclease, partial [Candidatus Acidiferrales bacterium]
MKHAVRSMTGFAQARAERNGWSVRVNLRSVNHRFLDLRLRLPDGLESLEPQLRQALRQRLRRGHVDATVYFEQTGGSAVQVNREVAAAYMKVARELKEEFGVASELDLAGVLRLPGVIASPDMLPEAESEQVGASVRACLDEAVSRLEEMQR